MLDAKTTDGKTALALATIKGALQIVSYLCKTGANTEVVDHTLSSTACHWAGTFQDSL
jgi:ankyrin repeat protein